MSNKIDKVNIPYIKFKIKNINELNIVNMIELICEILINSIKLWLNGVPFGIFATPFRLISLLDIIHRTILKLKEHLSFLKPDDYMRMTCNYTGKPLKDAIKIARYGKYDHKRLWFKKERQSEIEQIAFYLESNFYIFRQPWRYRTTTWHYIALLSNRNGKVLDYGCGAGIFVKWLATNYPEMYVVAADIPSTSLNFVKWNTKKLKNVKIITVKPGVEGIPINKPNLFDVIYCNEVMEHLPHPFEVAQKFVYSLKPGGYLIINYIYAPGGENLEIAARMRKSVISYLFKQLIPLIPIVGNSTGLYKKPKNIGNI